MGQQAFIDTRSDTIVGQVVRIDPAVRAGTITIDIALPPDLPPSARPDLSVDGNVVIDRLDDVLYMGRPTFGQANSQITVFRLTAQGDGGPIELRGCLRHTRAAGEVAPQRLARAGVRLLWKPADCGGGRSPRHRSPVGHLPPGQHPQQRGLADAVRADDADPGAGPHGERDAPQHHLGPVVTHDPGCHQHGLRRYRRPVVLPSGLEAER